MMEPANPRWQVFILGSCWIPGSWDLPMSYNPIVVTLSSLKPFFFNGLKKELCFSDHAWGIRPRNPIRAKRYCARLSVLEEGGVAFLYLEGLCLPEGCEPKRC